MAVAARSQASSLRLAMTTSAPASANAVAISSPSPRLPPVTRATWPARGVEGSVTVMATLYPSRLAACPSSPSHGVELGQGVGVPLSRQGPQTRDVGGGEQVVGRPMVLQHLPRQRQLVHLGG